MGLRGPAPRGNKAMPKFVVCRPNKPSYLTDVASEYWDEIVPMLEKSGVLNETHGPALTMMCEAYADTLHYRKNIREYHDRGYMPIIKGSTGNKMAHPVIKLLKSAQDTYIEISKSFGMTPMSIGRVDVGEKPKPEPKVKETTGSAVARFTSDELEDGIDAEVERIMSEPKEIKPNANS